MKLTQKQLRRLIRESVKQRLVEAEGMSVRSEVESSGEVQDLVIQLISELLQIANGDSESSDDESNGALMSAHIIDACVAAVEDVRSQNSGSEEEDVKLPPPHPKGSMKGEW